jgi:hypothetical protein
MRPKPPRASPDGGSDGVSPARGDDAGETPSLPGGNLPRLLLESVGVAWLAVVAAQYGLKMLLVALPAAADLSPAYLPLLASTLIAGIIAHHFCRPEEPSGPSRPAEPEPPGPASAPRETLQPDEYAE